MIGSLLRSLHRPIYSHRQNVLVHMIGPHLKPGDRVLDAGCGFGHLGRALMDAFPDVRVEGVENVRREGELIPVTAYEGARMPWDDGVFDVVILADVLHHDVNPQRLLAEAVRVSRRLVIIKDHLREGFLAQKRISFLDWAANAGYQVPCTYRYNNLAEWRQAITGVGSKFVEERTSINVYPPPFNTFLGGGLHYWAVFGR